MSERDQKRRMNTMIQSDTKQVIVVRKDLNMRKGKIAAQVAHASIAVLLDRMERTEDPYHPILWFRFGVEKNTAMHQWLTERFTKICVSVDSEKDLVDIYSQAIKLKLPCSLITDAGLTEFHGVPTITCAAIGPAYSDEIDHLTGHLKLL
jgi:PTH2 family peptidyl-tRNA hydrolase